MAKDALGSFLLVLHSHIPYVIAHGRWPHGTDWLTEASAECYIPLLDTFYTLAEEGHSPKVTVGITPVLAEQLEDDSFKYELITYLQAKIDACEMDEKHFRSEGLDHIADLTGYWRDYFTRVFRNYRRKYKKSVVGAFRELQDAGHIEIITSGATHGYFPLLSQDTSVQAQVKQGVETYRKHFGRDPVGFWVPECAYRPRYTWSYPVSPDGREALPYLRKGVEEFLSENGIKYFFVESHLIRGGDTLGVYAGRFDLLKKLWDQFEKHYLPVYVERTEHQAYYVQSYGEGDPVAIFARDQRTSSQVWSAAHGYPGDEVYLEFHKKHFPGGHRYWRVTGGETDLGHKQEYYPEWAEEKAYSHADHFVGLVKDVLREHKDKFGIHGVICSPFDTELFGHWWFEGPRWIYNVIKRMSNDPEIELVTCSEHLENHPPTAGIPLPEGSWGEGGFHWIWLNQQTAWTWQMVYDAEIEMRELSSKLADTDNETIKRILKQAARELFLLQSSDWQFNISTQNSTDYAESRLKEHYKSFTRLAKMAKKLAEGQELLPDDEDFLEYSEERDQIFDNIDPAWFAAVEKPAKQA